jgi:hypothetical protein
MQGETSLNLYTDNTLSVKHSLALHSVDPLPSISVLFSKTMNVDVWCRNGVKNCQPPSVLCKSWMGEVENRSLAFGTGQISRLVKELLLLLVSRPPFCMILYRKWSVVVGEVFFWTGEVENPSLAFGTVQICHVVTELLPFPVRGRHFVWSCTGSGRPL